MPLSTSRVVGAALLLAFATPAARAQLQQSVVSGRVLDPAGAPVAGAQVALMDSLGQPVSTAAADDEGRFRLRSVAPGVYQLGAQSPPLRSAVHRVSVRDGQSIEVDLTLSPQLNETVVVASDTTGAGGSSGTTLAGETVRRVPTPLRGSALRSAVAATPGWTAEDNGLMHYRGVDDGLLFVLDGIPVYERLDAQFGVGFDPLTLGSARVLSGYIPAEFGLRSGGVIDVRSQAGAIDAWRGFVEAGAGSERAQALTGLAQGPLGANVAMAVTMGGERAHRFLDPVSLDNLHNHGSTRGGEVELVWSAGLDVVTARGGVAGSAFDVPNDPEQEVAGQDQRQELDQAFGTLNWQRSWSSSILSQLAVFGRFTSGKLLPSEFDTPLSAQADRTQDRTGVLAGVGYETGRHRFKVGFEASSVRLDEDFRFFVTDAEEGEENGEDADGENGGENGGGGENGEAEEDEEGEFSDAVLEHTEDNPFVFVDSVRRPVYSFYVQDSWRATDQLTIDAGVRFDHSRLLLSESQWSPRVGASYRMGRATLRASLNRFFQPPQTENLLLSSSPEAHALSPFTDELGGGADVPAERQTAYEAGVELWLGGALRADLAVWRRSIRNAGDPNVFAGTTLIFPNSVAEGIAKGFDLRLELTRRAGLAGFVTYTLGKVDQFGPINGGLFLEDEVIEIGPGTKFTPDHDIRHNLTGELSYQDDRRGVWVALGGRYRTGTPLEVDEDELDELAERPGAELVDFEAQRTRPYAVFDLQAGVRLMRRERFELSARGALLNIGDESYAYNFGNPFSGTHFGAPRSARLDLRLALR